MIVTNSITSRLKRKENEFLHQKVDTICIKELGAFQHIGRRLGPFKVGHPYTLDNFIARILVEEGFLKYDEKGKLDRKGIQKINFQESTSTTLSDLNEKDYIYVQAHEQLEVLNTLYHQGKIPRQEFTQFYSDVNDLIKVRTSKIIRLALQSNQIRAKKQLTSEEQILFERMSKVMHEWKKHLGKIDSPYEK